jgi:hypothetical protein
MEKLQAALIAPLQRTLAALAMQQQSAAAFQGPKSHADATPCARLRPSAITAVSKL